MQQPLRNKISAQVSAGVSAAINHSSSSSSSWMRLHETVDAYQLATVALPFAMKDLNFRNLV